MDLGRQKLGYNSIICKAKKLKNKYVELVYDEKRSTTQMTYVHVIYGTLPQQKRSHSSSSKQVQKR